MASRSKHQIGRMADQLLALAGVSAPPIPIERIAKLRGANVRYVPFEGELSGMLFRDNDQIIIGVNATHHKTRQRFTIAHELGHLELHHQDTIHVDRGFPLVLLRNERSSQAVDQNEIEANAFAAALLMPTDFLKQDLAGEQIDLEEDMKIRELAERYKVSLQAIVYRLTNIAHLLSVP